MTVGSTGATLPPAPPTSHDVDALLLSATAVGHDRSRSQRSCDASDTDQGALGVREMTNYKPIR